MKQLGINVLALLAVLFHAQTSSARWLDRLAFPSQSFVQSANGRANAGRCIDFAPETATEWNGADLVLQPCYVNNPKNTFHIGTLDNYGMPIISNALPELNRRCWRRDAYCTFECPNLTTNGPSSEYWLDGTRLACSLNDQDRLSCVTAVPLLGPSTVDGGCACECDWRDPGHRGLMPSQSKQWFPVPQLRTSPDMPEVLRKTLTANATVGK
ncbi:hypothetical protein AMAG_05168 [Allomyces macrogynus ATCC 38327]|uniref:Cyanovirin-N domain-containing protein n=1 Tax=Allomyces macrogynus (strain ATCC 38327) TaxID=578462 RepID=A0A0L0SBC2_ALLM3|nr:hypothetical protein AMAG_05168 [Allomyces macrogynus ATCC 38327]|eukprot:KNE59704.1 hypothetical protein AMAG_05168 [Allomyces macrogynus ATCC 38327]